MDAFPGVADGLLRQFCECARAVAAAEGSEACDAAGNGCRADASAGHLIDGLGVRGELAGGKEPLQLSVVPDHGDEIASQSAHMRVEDGEGEVGGDGGVNGVAAGSQNRQSG